MGRKIPGRKHRGIRDPEKQRQERLSRMKQKINQPPSHLDDQEIPKSLSRLMEWKENTKSGTIPLKRKEKKVIVDKTPDKPTPTFIQDPGETDKHFLLRVNRMCKSVIQETAFENKYKVNIKRNSVTGKVEGVVKQKKDELKEYMKQVKKEQNQKGKKKKKKQPETEKLTKSQKRQVKLKEKKENKLANKPIEFNDYQDRVGFGEIVHEPPTLTAPRRVQKADGAPRPGAKNLLLKSVFNKSDDKAPKIIKNGVIDKKGKRKDMPNRLRRQLDRQQSAVIEAYKNLKKQKYVNK